MTEQERVTFLKNQTVLKNSDLIKVNGKVYVKIASVDRISETYDMGDYPKQAIGIPIETVVQRMFYGEMKKRQTPTETKVEEDAKIETPVPDPVKTKMETERESVYRFIKEKVAPLDDAKKNDPIFVATYLTVLFRKVSQPVVADAVKKACAEGLLSNESMILNYHKVFYTYSSRLVRKLKAYPPEEKEKRVSALSKELYQAYKAGLPFSNLTFILKELRLDSTVYEKVESSFYQWMVPDFEEFCQHTTKRGKLLAFEIVHKYGNLNLDKVFQKLEEVADPSLRIHSLYAIVCPESAKSHIDNILMEISKKTSTPLEAFQQLIDLGYGDTFVLAEIANMKAKGLRFEDRELYAAYYERFKSSATSHMIVEYLKKAAEQKLSAQEIVARLKKFEYPDNFMAQLLDENLGLELPYDELYPLLGRKKNVIKEVKGLLAKGSILGSFHLPKRKPKEEEEEKDIPNPEEEEREEKVEPEEEVVEEIEDPTKIAIVSREKKLASADKKTLLSLIIAAAGGISTAVLTCIFKVNPVVAAQNCAAAIANFTAGNLALQQLVPASKELIGLLTSIGTTFAGTIAYLRTKKKRDKLLKEMEEPEEVVEEETETLEEPQEEKGGRTR